MGRSYKLDDNDEHLPFLRGIKEELISNNLIHLVMEKYNDNCDLMYHLCEYTIEMRLKKASYALKCQVSI